MNDKDFNDYDFTAEKGLEALLDALIHTMRDALEESLSTLDETQQVNFVFAQVGWEYGASCLDYTPQAREKFQCLNQ